MPIRMKTSGPVYAAPGTHNDPPAPAPEWRREAIVNELSAWVSIAALAVLLLDDKAMLFEFQTWQHFLPTARNPATVQSMQAFQGEIEGACDIPKLEIANFAVLAERDGVTNTYYAMPLAFEMMSFYPSFLLICVLAWSAGFQSYRSTSINRAQLSAMGRPSARLEHLSISVWLAVGAHLLLWVRLFSLKTPAVADGTKIVFLLTTTLVAFAPILTGIRYRGNGPDFGRWVEYAITSPLQIVIIACSVWTRDRGSLYALFAAQANLMICGAMIETGLQKMYKCQAKIARLQGAMHGMDASSTVANASESDDDEDARALTLAQHVVARQNKRLRAVYMTLGVLGIAWASFVLIWYVVITQFQRQNTNAGACDACAAFRADDCPTKKPLDTCELSGGVCRGRNDIPPAVVWIVATQCVFFGLFGVVQSLQLYLSQQVVSVEKARLAWHSASYYYAILSVTAKSALEIGFLVMLSQMPGSARKA